MFEPGNALKIFSCCRGYLGPGSDKLTHCGLVMSFLSCYILTRTKWWLFVNWTSRNKRRWHFSQNANICNHENVFESVVCETCSPRCVKPILWPCFLLLFPASLWREWRSLEPVCTLALRRSVPSRTSGGCPSGSYHSNGQSQRWPAVTSRKAHGISSVYIMPARQTIPWNVLICHESNNRRIYGQTYVS